MRLGCFPTLGLLIGLSLLLWWLLILLAYMAGADLGLWG